MFSVQQRSTQVHYLAQTYLFQSSPAVADTAVTPAKAASISLLRSEPRTAPLW